MRSMLSAALACSLLQGCYLAHELLPVDPPPSDPPPSDPPPSDPPPSDPPPIPEGFVFLRASEPGPFPIRSPDRWLHLESESWRTTQIIALDGSAHGLYEQRTSEGIATLRRSDRPGTMQWSGGVPREPGIEGATSLSGADESVLYFTAEGVIRADLDGAETHRWALPGGAAFADSNHQVVVRTVPPPISGEPSDRVSILDLSTSEQHVVSTGATGDVRDVFFGTRHVILSLGRLGDAFAPITHELVSVDLSTFEATPLDTSDLTVAAFDRCADRLLTIDPVGRVIAIDARTGRHSEVSAPLGARAYETYRPFAALAALSPDGRHLVWFGNLDDDERVFVVSDLSAGVSDVVSATAVPVPWGCCETREIDATLGSFRDGHLAIGVGARSLVPICSCAGPEHPVPTAFRLQLDPVALVEVPHCGRSTPWMLEGGAMLVCDEDDSERVRLAVAHEGERTTVTDGPWDVAALPLFRDDQLGCAAP